MTGYTDRWWVPYDGFGGRYWGDLSALLRAGWRIQDERPTGAWVIR